MKDTSPQNSLTGDTILFGNDPTERIVAVEPDYQEGVWVYFREGEKIRREQAPFQPWILLTQKPSFDLPNAHFTELDGEGYSLLAEFPNQSSYQGAKFRIRDDHLANLTYAGGAKLSLMRSGKTLFKGMTFYDVVRMQFDLETNGLDPEPEANRILLIAVSDNRGLLEILEGDEKQILQKFVTLIQERDPDALEGHNLLGFDFPFLIRRALRNGVRLSLGRDGSEPRQGQERNYAIAASNSRPYIPISVYGRHIVDTYLVVQRFDWAKQALTSYGLKECARVFGFAAADRVELPRDQMQRLYQEKPELVTLYASQDVIETRQLAELISPVEFYQTQMVPDNFGQVILTGNGEKINSLFLRAYLAAGKSIPHHQSSRPFAGGYTEVRAKGVLERVVKADVESLYPSLMLTHQIAPESDTLGVFLPALHDLTQRRLEAKRKASQTEDTSLPDTQHPTPDTRYWEGLQGSFKVLINSFYGYLGGPFYFNDYNGAEKVTEFGRALVQDIAARMEQTGSTIIEIDTDGVYFVPPDHIQEEKAERAYIGEIGSVLPEGIRLAFDGRFEKMLSLKTKNYVLLTYAGKTIFKGASLRSRADERYGRHFLAEAVTCLLKGDLDSIAERYAQTIEALLQRQIPIGDLVRRERITEKTFQSDLKKRAAKVASGIAVGEHVQVYEKADGSLGLLAEYAQDENVKYYMDKLYKFAKRLEEAFGDSFDRLIPKPTAQGLPKQLQTTLDLF